MNQNFDFETVHILGTGSFSKEVSHLMASRNKKIKFIFYSDGNTSNIEFKSLDSLLNVKESTHCVIAIGDLNIRKRIYEKLITNSFLKFPNIDFRNTIAYPDSSQNIIGVGNIIMPNALIGVYSSIGSVNIIGSNTGIGHHVIIGDYNFIGPNSFLAGSVQIGSCCCISFGSGFMPKVRVESFVNSMPYTVFYKNVTKSGVYAGNPAKNIM